VTLPPTQLPDLAKKAPRVKRAAPEKKTGVPTPSKQKPQAELRAKRVGKGRAVKTANAEQELASAH
jgi:hypothetical protein